jgi:GNAT superfamily N-acetyltransferase
MTIEILSITPENVEKHGFFCYKSKPKAPGRKLKLEWFRQRFAEGMAIKLLIEDGRQVGFIEYTEGEHAWRAVEAPGYLMIHCLWVVGKAKGKGYGTLLLNECLADAEVRGRLGVAMVASSGTWLAGPELFLVQDFECISQAPPCFGLLVKRLADGPLPAFPQDWPERLERLGDGLIVLYTDQCPYLDDDVQRVSSVAQELGLPFQARKLVTSQQVRQESPSPYGVYAIVYNHQLLSYHYTPHDELIAMIRACQSN